jgi:hypothetical protein
MWLGDITVGDSTDPTATPVVDPNAAPSASNGLINLAAGLVNAIKPYGSGVPVNFAISPQTQSFLIAGGVLIGGLVIISMMRARR